MHPRRLLAFVILLIAMAPLHARAQAPATKGFGIEGGVNLSYLTVVPKGAPRSMGTGAMVGLFGVVPLTSTISLQPELQYSQHKSKLGTGATERDVDFSYISIPLLVRMPMFGLYITEGPSFNLPVKAEIGGRDAKDTLRSPDISLVIGVGANMGRFSIEARWDSGLRRIEKAAPVTGGPHRSRTITGLLAVRL